MSSSRIGQIGVPAAVVSVVVMMVVPLPALLLDLLLTANLALAVLVLLTSMYVRRALDFSVFPSLLLVATMFRLSLNVSSTRLVLLDGYAGKVIESFGRFVVGGSVVVGLVIFLILVVIQFIVITNGAGRVAEVAARFTLDAMPGKQMAIDADLNAGLIDDVEARRRRHEVAAEADFYGAMDGASKFVKGDAIAGIVITLVNLLGGFVVGAVQRGLTLGEAMSTYSLLTVGDGLVSQIPALLISVSTGLIVTRAATQEDMGTDLVWQLGSQARALRVAGVCVGGLAIVPGLPKLPFLLVGAGMWFAATRASGPADDAGDPAEEAAAAAQSARDTPETLASEMRVEPLELELSYDLLDLVDASRGGDLLDRVRALRRQLAMELGVVIPPVRTRDNLELPTGSYVVKVHGVEVGRGSAPSGMVLVLGDHRGDLPGTPTREPVFGMEATWVPVEFAAQAHGSGGTVVDRSSVVTTHLAEIARAHAGRLLSRQDVKLLVDTVRAGHPVVVDELNAAGLSLADVQRVLENLLDERVSVRDLVTILEVLSERGRTTKDVEGLTEAARSALGAAVAATWAVDGRLPIVTLEPLVEQALLDALRTGETGSFFALDPARTELVLTEIAAVTNRIEEEGEQPVLVCAPVIRPALRRLVRGVKPDLPVLAYAELGSQLRIDTKGMVSIVEPAAV